MIKKSSFITLTKSQKLMIKNGWGEEAADTTLNKLTYSSEGNDVEAYISTPAGITESLPMIIWNRGGGGRKGKLDDFLAYGLLGEISSWGYMVVASQYREPDEFGGGDLNDIINLYNITKEFEEFDKKSLAVEGWSRGGMMTYLLLQKHIPINFKCAVIIAGLSNIRRNIRINNNLKEKVLSTYNRDDMEKEIDERSASVFYKNIRNIPILLLHGTNDEKIDYKDSTEMKEKLIENGNSEVVLKLFKKDDHLLRKSKKEVSELKKSWYSKYLKFNNY